MKKLKTFLLDRLEEHAWLRAMGEHWAIHEKELIAEILKIIDDEN